jgi:hypothetical protein
MAGKKIRIYFSLTLYNKSLSGSCYGFAWKIPTRTVDPCSLSVPGSSRIDMATDGFN